MPEIRFYSGLCIHLYAFNLGLQGRNKELDLVEKQTAPLSTLLDLIKSSAISSIIQIIIDLKKIIIKG